jgi:SAM-dependent methyltransferase
MFSKLKNKLENYGREKQGKEPLDRDIVSFLEEKYKDNAEERNNAKYEILSYLDNLELRADLLRNKTALDIGSSKHFFDEYCKEKYNTDFVALDIDEENLGKSHKMGVVADARTLPFKNEAFDLVISHASMPHLFAPTDDDNREFVPIEGKVKEQALEDILSVFEEAYRVLKAGGQIRMNTFSEKEVEFYRKIRAGRTGDTEVKTDDGRWILLDEEKSDYQQIARIRVVKEALEIFEKESGARCMFKDEEHGGLIIILKA